jgi:hypothetical protein
MCFIIIWSEMGIWDTEHNHAGTHCRRRLRNHSCTREFTRTTSETIKIAKQSLEVVWKMAIFSLLPESLAENGCLLSSYFVRVFFFKDGSRRTTILFQSYIKVQQENKITTRTHKINWKTRSILSTSYMRWSRRSNQRCRRRRRIT